MVVLGLELTTPGSAAVQQSSQKETTRQADLPNTSKPPFGECWELISPTELRFLHFFHDFVLHLISNTVLSSHLRSKPCTSHWGDISCLHPVSSIQVCLHGIMNYRRNPKLWFFWLILVFTCLDTELLSQLKEGAKFVQLGRQFLPSPPIPMQLIPILKHRSVFWGKMICLCIQFVLTY